MKKHSKATPPDGTAQDWQRYYAEQALLDYQTRYAPLAAKATQEIIDLHTPQAEETPRG